MLTRLLLILAALCIGCSSSPTKVKVVDDVQLHEPIRIRSSSSLTPAVFEQNGQTVMALYDPLNAVSGTPPALVLWKFGKDLRSAERIVLHPVTPDFDQWKAK